MVGNGDTVEVDGELKNIREIKSFSVYMMKELKVRIVFSSHSHLVQKV